MKRNIKLGIIACGAVATCLLYCNRDEGAPVIPKPLKYQRQTNVVKGPDFALDVDVIMQALQYKYYERGDAHRGRWIMDEDPQDCRVPDPDEPRPKTPPTKPSK